MFKYVLFFLITSPLFANPCLIPFTDMTNPLTKKPYEMSDVLNPSQNLESFRRNRYIVADLNTADKAGLCRGVQEKYATIETLTDFTEGIFAKEDKENFTQQVERFRTAELVRPPVYQGYCVGQTLNLCEIQNGQPVLIATFITSSAKTLAAAQWSYAPRMYIKTRRWSSDRVYGPEDQARDERMDGGNNKVLKFQGRWEMPNFMNFLPDQGMKGNTQNGIHEIAGGLDSGGTFGAPVSLGCIRLRDYSSKFARWWTPIGAKFFMHFNPKQYKKFGNSKTNQAL